MLAFHVALATASPLIVAAADVTGGGIGELHYLAKDMTGAMNVTVDSCPSVVRGLLYGYDVVLAYTGIGFLASGLCMKSLLPAFTPTAVVFIGTSGFSPQIGGVFDTSNTVIGESGEFLGRDEPREPR